MEYQVLLDLPVVLEAQVQQVLWVPRVRLVQQVRKVHME